MMHNPKPENAIKPKPPGAEYPSKAKQALIKALDLLLDEYDEDPRNPVIKELQQLVNAQDDIPSGEVELTAVLSPGGAYKVHDQHGRPVKGVKSVAVFPDQSGQSVFQINL
jgi:hypothetical protein